MSISEPTSISVPTAVSGGLAQALYGALRARAPGCAAPRLQCCACRYTTPLRLPLPAASHASTTVTAPCPAGSRRHGRRSSVLSSSARRALRYPFVASHRGGIVGTTSYSDYQPLPWPVATPLQRSDQPDAVEIGYTWLAATLYSQVRPRHDAASAARRAASLGSGHAERIDVGSDHMGHGLAMPAVVPAAERCVAFSGHATGLDQLAGPPQRIWIQHPARLAVRVRRGIKRPWSTCTTRRGATTARVGESGECVRLKVRR